jgi:hypothetical protein
VIRPLPKVRIHADQSPGADENLTRVGADRKAPADREDRTTERALAVSIARPDREVRAVHVVHVVHAVQIVAAKADLVFALV